MLYILLGSYAAWAQYCLLYCAHAYGKFGIKIGTFRVECPKATKKYAIITNFRISDNFWVNWNAYGNYFHCINVSVYSIQLISISVIHNTKYTIIRHSKLSLCDMTFKRVSA